MQTIIRHRAPEQLSNVQLREWQRYRGWTVKILEELEHSGGMTTSEVSSRAGCRCTLGKVLLQRMMNQDLVERVERWGWRITRDGLYLLSLNYVNTRLTHGKQTVNTTLTQEKEEPAPMCFHAPTCHIKRLCQDKRYTLKNMTLCRHCVWDSPTVWKIPIVPVEMKRVGITGKQAKLECVENV